MAVAASLRLHYQEQVSRVLRLPGVSARKSKHPQRTIKLLPAFNIAWDRFKIQMRGATWSAPQLYLLLLTSAIMPKIIIASNSAMIVKAMAITRGDAAEEANAQEFDHGPTSSASLTALTRQ